jgi:hypothetical protein
VLFLLIGLLRGGGSALYDLFGSIPPLFGAFCELDGAGMLEMLVYSIVVTLEAVEAMSVVCRTGLDQADVDDFLALAFAVWSSEGPSGLLGNAG